MLGMAKSGGRTGPELFRTIDLQFGLKCYYQTTMTSQQIAYPIADKLYLSITDRCTLECRFCPKTQGSYEVQGYDLRMAYRPEVDDILQALPELDQYSEVVFCGYGEPTLRLKVLLAVAAELKKRGKLVRLNTDGLGSLVNKRNILPELGEVIDKVSVSMNAQTEAIYDKHCEPQLPGAYQAMLDFLTQAPNYIADVTATAINGLEAVDVNECRRIAEKLGVKFRQRELDIVG